MTSRTAWARRSRTGAISWPVFRALFADGSTRIRSAPKTGLMSRHPDRQLSAINGP
jgi:hypothetical protein